MNKNVLKIASRKSDLAFNYIGMTWKDQGSKWETQICNEASLNLVLDELSTYKRVVSTNPQGDRYSSHLHLASIYRSIITLTYKQ